MALRFIFIAEFRGENFPTIFPLFRRRQKKISSAGLRFHERDHLFIFPLQIS